MSRWGPARQWTCPRQCGWFRSWNDSAAWKDRVIDHPTYGPLRNMQIVTMDIDRHNCYDHKLAARDYERKTAA